MKPVWLLALASTLALSPAAADRRGKRAKYVGLHPIPKGQGGGLCHIEAPHVHVWGPDVRANYRDHRGYNYFVGDPVAYGWDGPKHAYRGNHPIHVHAVLQDEYEDVEYCYLNGPHYHYYAPPPAVAAEFKLTGGVYYYVAEPPPVYVEAQPEYAEINAVYEPMVYVRPVIAVDVPPPGWIGARVDLLAPAVVVDSPRPRPAPVAAGVGVGVSAGVQIQVPSVSFEIGAPAVIVGGHTHTTVIHDHDHDHDSDHRHKHKKVKVKDHRGGGRDHRKIDFFGR